MNYQPLINYVFRYLTYFLIFGFAIVLLTACEEDDKPVVNDDNISLSTEKSEAVVKNYSSVNANLQVARNMGSGIIPFNDGEGLNGKAFRKWLKSLENARTHTDSIHFKSCADIDLSIRDGSVTITIDYGEEGCEEGGNLLKGKITETFSFAEDSLFQSTIYENFSFNDVTINGTRSAGFAVLSLDLEQFKVVWSEDLQITWTDGKSYTLKSELSSVYDGEKVAIEGFSIITESNGDSYAATIINPLIYTIDCMEQRVYAPVEGVELLVFNGDSINIDYGSGDCDYLVEITRNGETTVVDIAEEYKDIEFAFGFIFLGGNHGSDGDDGDDHHNDCIEISGDVVSETRELNDFQNISVYGIARVFLTQGNEQSVVVKAPENLMTFVETTVDDNTLMVQLTDSLCFKGYRGDSTFIDIIVTVPEITGIDIHGVGTIVGDSSLKGDSLFINLAGASTVDLELDFHNLSLSVKGAGKLSLSGQINSQHIELTGASYYNGFELTSDNCEIDISGAGIAKVTVEKNLDVTIDGAGKVYYKGNPEIISDIGFIGQLINAN